MAGKEYRIQLENVFEGPMDLLVHLIKKNEVDIYDIPVGLLTDQYLAYIDWMQTMNIDFASEFIVMAATLTQIKSRMLLPSPEGVDNEEEDPRNELTQPLIEYMQIKEAAEQLAGRDLLGQDTFVRLGRAPELTELSKDQMVQIDLFELIDAFRSILDKMTAEHQVDLTTETISVKDRINQIVEVIEKDGSATFSTLLGENPQRADIIITFLAILEMAKLNLIQIAQHLQTGIIRIFYL